MGQIGRRKPKVRSRDEQGAVPFDNELRFDDRGAYEHQPPGTRGAARRRGGATPRGGATTAASRSAGPPRWPHPRREGLARARPEKVGTGDRTQLSPDRAS